MDRRLMPGNDRAALESLRGIVATQHFVPGEAACITSTLVDLCTAPGGARDRQLLMGAAVTVIDSDQGWAFVQHNIDGHCGYLPDAALGAPVLPTHWVSAPATQLYAEPRVQARDLDSLSFGARLTVVGTVAGFAQTSDGFVPAQHLRPIGTHFDDPVAVAALFIGTPYLWGGNSRAGIDCSGLVQLALLACGQPCPSDSDLQRNLGTELAPDAPVQRGDLLFWAGHVAFVADETHLIHASGHAMATVVEPTDEAIARIAATGKLVLARRRL